MTPGARRKRPAPDSRPDVGRFARNEERQMKLHEQRELLRNFCNSVCEAMIRESENWPERWNGHELRELAAYHFDSERTTAMREDRGRKRRFNRENVARFQSCEKRTA